MRRLGLVNEAFSVTISMDGGKIQVSTNFLKEVAAGDSTAVQRCIDAYGGLIWSLARRWTRNQADAEDAVQEIFIDVWKSASSFDEARSSEKTYVAMIARRRLIDRLRREERAPEVRPIQEAPEPMDESHRLFDQRTDAALASRALRELQPEQRKVLAMSIHLGMSHGEISEVTQLALGTVKSHIRRGLIAVRDRIKHLSNPVERRVSQ